MKKYKPDPGEVFPSQMKKNYFIDVKYCETKNVGNIDRPKAQNINKCPSSKLKMLSLNRQFYEDKENDEESQDYYDNFLKSISQHNKLNRGKKVINWINSPETNPEVSPKLLKKGSKTIPEMSPKHSRKGSKTIRDMSPKNLRKGSKTIFEMTPKNLRKESKTIFEMTPKHFRKGSKINPENSAKHSRMVFKTNPNLSPILANNLPKNKSLRAKTPVIKPRIRVNVEKKRNIHFLIEETFKNPKRVSINKKELYDNILSSNSNNQPNIKLNSLTITNHAVLLQERAKKSSLEISSAILQGNNKDIPLNVIKSNENGLKNKNRTICCIPFRRKKVILSVNNSILK